MTTAISLKILGDWQRKVDVPLQNVLAVSMDVCGRTGAEACKHAVILEAQSMASPRGNLTPTAPARRKVETDPLHHNAQFVRTYHGGVESKLYRWNFLNKDPLPGTWDQAQRIAHRGLARRSWMWGLRKFGADKGSRPIAGVARTLTILNEKTCGYILQNSLKYLLKILPSGWQARAAQLASNKILKQAAMKIEAQWRSEMRRARRGGMAVGGPLAKHFLRGM